MSRAWLREEQADLAVEKILEAAAIAFVKLGVSRAGMADIAKYAGCSRGTLYRYFKTRHELHLAYVNHCALAISDRVRAGLAEIEDPHERLIEGVVRSCREVRAIPGAAAWFEPGDSGIAARMSGGSEVLAAMAGAFVGQLLGRDGDAEDHMAAHWLIRVMVSLLTIPCESEEEERDLVRRFVAPCLLGDPSKS